MNVTEAERAKRNAIGNRILAAIAENRTVKLPVFDPTRERPSDQFALVNVGIEPNDFGDTAGPFRYQFEGEEDLLHLIITRNDGEKLSVAEGQEVAGFVLNGVPRALVWLKPGEYSQHFYVGHDLLVDNWKLD